MKIFGFFAIFGVDSRHFHSTNCNKLFKKAYWTTKFFLVDLFQRSNLHSPSKTWKKCIKTLEVENFRFFVISGVSLRHFHLKNSIKLLGEAYWTPHSFLVDHFQRSFLQSLSKNWRKMHELFKI